MWFNGLVKYLFISCVFESVLGKPKWYKSIKKNSKNEFEKIRKNSKNEFGINSLFRRLDNARTDDTSCGNVNENFQLGTGVTYACENDICTMSCSDPSASFATIDTITCSSGAFSPLGGGIECQSTKCGEPLDWGFGEEYLSMNIECGFQNSRQLAICHVACTVNGNSGFSLDADGQQFTTLVCQDDRTLLPAAGSLTLHCAETPCGVLSDTFEMGNVISSCAESGCTFSCDNPAEIPTYSKVECADDGYKHVDGSDTNSIACVPAQQTPCGNVIDHFTFTGETPYSVECDSFDSIYQTEKTTCTVTCQESTVLIGDSTLQCENGVFTNTNRALSCKQTACGNVDETFTVEEGASVSCSDNECTVGCDNAAESALVDQVFCNKTSAEFNNVVLWPDTSNPLINPSLSCSVQHETLCGNGNEFTNVSAGTVIECNYASSSCHVTCDNTLPFHAQPNIQNIGCNPNTLLFDTPFDTSLNCELYAVQCGNVEDNFNVGNGVVTNCVHDEVHGADVCGLSCVDTSLIVHGFSEVTCDHSSMLFNIPTGSAFNCVTPPDTSCGYLSEHYTIDSSVGEVVCNDRQCYHSCDDELDYLAVPLIQCVESTQMYYPANGEIKCEKGYDTGCGNVVADGNSIKTCEDNTCTFTCPEGKILHGIESATCHIYNGKRSLTYESKFNTGEAFSAMSECVDTMCGDIAGINLQLDNQVVLNTSSITADGYGAIMFECAESKVVSGLRGHSAIACLPNGFFDVLYPNAVVSCSDTSCGDLTDGLDVHTDVSATCVEDTCKFSCPAGHHGITIAPSIPSIICDSGTGHFLTNSKSVECMNSCEPFASENNAFSVSDNVMIFCDKYRAGTPQYCDLICKRPFHSLKPVVIETKQKLEKIKCEKNKHGEGSWQSVVYDVIGMPRDRPLVRQPLNKQTVVCEPSEQYFLEEVETCDYIKDAYSFDSMVVIRCTQEICLFTCPNGFKLNTDVTRVLCKARDGITTWTPKYESEIGCDEETTTIAPVTTSKSKKTKKPAVPIEDTSDTSTESLSPCGPITIKHSSDVEIFCTTAFCSFTCLNATLLPNVELVKCDRKKKSWKIPKKTKKITCTLDGLPTCSAPKISDGVLASCNTSECTFECSLDNHVPNADSAKCKNGKWKFSSKTKKVACNPVAAKTANMLDGMVNENTMLLTKH